ncbi:MAG: glycosyltransferase family 4 protein, partial [Gemmatimonadales bacterium]
MFTPGGVDRTGVDRVVPALLWQIERLARRHAVHVFALSQETEPAHWELLGAHIHNIGTTNGRRRRFVSWFRAEHTRAPFDVMQAFWAGPSVYPIVATLWRDIPFVVHLAGGELVALDDIGYGGRRNWRDRTLIGATVTAADRVSVASGYMRQLARSNGCEADQIPLGVALDKWPVCAPRHRDLDGPARLLHVGDIRPVKGQDMLLRSAALMRDRGVKFHLDIAGYDSMNGEMQALAGRLGLSSLLTWHGLLRRTALRELMEASDVLLVTSRHDAGPLVVLEAAIAGVPTVGTAVGHIADWAPDAALCVRGWSDTDFASEVMGLLVDERRRLSIAHEAQRRAVSIDADFTASLFEDMYDDVTTRRRIR